MDISPRAQGIYRFGPFALDSARRALTCRGVRVKLAERLFDTLLYLVANHGRVVERSELMQAVWSGRAVDENNISQAVFTLRKALQQEAGEETYIVTAPGRGYRFAFPVTYGLATDDAPAWQEPPAETVAPATEGPANRHVLTLVMAALALLVAVASLAHRQHTALPAAVAVQTPFSPPHNAVAVLAFDNLTGDPAQDYLSDGLSEQLIDSLVSVGALQVAGRASSFSFRGKPDTIPDIGRKLNVGAVIEGSVRRDGDRLRVTVQLVNALTGYGYWSKTFDRDRRDMLHVQADIAQAVTSALQVTLLGADVAKLTLGGTTQPGAFDAFLRGHKTLRAATGEAGYRNALRDFESALSQDEGFAEAHSYRALALSYIGATCVLHDHALNRTLFEQARKEADRAVALAPALGSAHAARGIVLAWGFLDFQAAAEEQARAVSLSPGSAEVQNGYAQAQIAMGNLAAAEQAARRAVQLDPMAPPAWFELGRTLFLARQYDAALDAVRHGQVVADKMPVRLSVLFCRIALMKGDAAEAVRVCGRGGDFGQITSVAIAEHALGHEDVAARERDRLHGWLGDEGAYLYALIDAQRGAHARALDWLETAYRLQDGGLIDLVTEPMLDPLRGDARFRALQARLVSP